MSEGRFKDEFKREAVAQGVKRGYSVAKVSERLGISTKSRYTWKTHFSQPRKQALKTTEQAAEIRRLKKELAVIKKAPRYPAGDYAVICREGSSSSRMQSEVRVYRRASPR